MCCAQITIGGVDPKNAGYVGTLIISGIIL
jgi:hypothetical protein